MTPQELRALADEVQRARPAQVVDDSELQEWARVLDGIRLPEALIAVAMLRQLTKRIRPERIAERVREARSHAVEPAGEAYFEALARRGGREYEGGPVCWPPDICVGSCTTCPNQAAGEVAR